MKLTKMIPRVDGQIVWGSSNDPVEKCIGRVLRFIDRVGPIEDYKQPYQIDMILMIGLWNEDGLKEALGTEAYDRFIAWWQTSALSPETITRARRWIVEHGWAELQPGVKEYGKRRAQRQRERLV